jgi:hypothetical protein
MASKLPLQIQVPVKNLIVAESTSGQSTDKVSAKQGKRAACDTVVL